MEYLKRHLNDYEDATQKEPKAKRALIHTLFEILSIAEVVEKDVKDKATFEALFEKFTSTKSKHTKGLLEIFKKIKHYDKEMNAFRDWSKLKLAGNSENPTVGGGGGNIIIDTAATVVSRSRLTPADEDPSARSRTEETSKVTEGKSGKKAPRGGKDKITLAMREEIWDKYIGDKAKAKCPVCQTSIIKMTGFSAGHIKAEAVGGVTNITNLVPICGHCNSRMSTENLYEYTEKNYLRAPVFPGLPAEETGDDDKKSGSKKKSEVKKGGGSGK